MSTESVKALVRQVVEDWHHADLAALDAHLDAGYVTRDPANPDVTDLDSYKTGRRAPGQPSPTCASRSRT
jgi:hypothetical protein